MPINRPPVFRISPSPRNPIFSSARRTRPPGAGHVRHRPPPPITSRHVASATYHRRRPGRPRRGPREPISYVAACLKPRPSPPTPAAGAAARLSPENSGATPLPQDLAAATGAARAGRRVAPPPRATAAVLAVRARPLLSFPGEAPYSGHHDHLAGDLGIRAMNSAATVF